MSGVVAPTLQRLLAAYGLTEAEFFGRTIEKEIAPWDLDENQTAKARLLDDLHMLPRTTQGHLLAKFQLMVETVVDMQGGRERPALPAPQERRHSAEY